ncbi:hypothetical protein ACJX0J_028342, partial [Zea mays]
KWVFSNLCIICLWAFLCAHFHYIWIYNLSHKDETIKAQQPSPVFYSITYVTYSKEDKVYLVYENIKIDYFFQKKKKNKIVVNSFSKAAGKLALFKANMHTQFRDQNGDMDEGNPLNHEGTNFVIGHQTCMPSVSNPVARILLHENKLTTWDISQMNNVDIKRLIKPFNEKEEDLIQLFEDNIILFAYSIIITLSQTTFILNGVIFKLEGCVDVNLNDDDQFWIMDFLYYNIQMIKQRIAKNMRYLGIPMHHKKINSKERRGVDNIRFIQMAHNKITEKQRKPMHEGGG